MEKSFSNGNGPGAATSGADGAPGANAATPLITGEVPLPDHWWKLV